MTRDPRGGLAGSAPPISFAQPDPRQLSRDQRRFTELTGLEAGPKLRVVLDRLEQEMGGRDEGDEDLGEFFSLRKKLLAGRLKSPWIADTLHFFGSDATLRPLSSISRAGRRAHRL